MYSRANRTTSEGVLRKRTNIDVDFQGFAAAIERTPLADVAKGVSKLAAVHGNRVTGLKLGKSQGWISKMRTIAKAGELPESVAGSLVLGGGVRDVEIAYYVTLIERDSRQKAREVAANIANETRQSLKRTYTQLRSSR
jgi:hypothetical protein